MSTELGYQPPDKPYDFWNRAEREEGNKFLENTFRKQLRLANFFYNKSFTLGGFDDTRTLLRFIVDSGSFDENQPLDAQIRAALEKENDDLFLSYIGIGTFAGEERVDDVLQYYSFGNNYLDFMDNPGQILNQPAMIVLKEGHSEREHIYLDHDDDDFRFMPITPDELQKIVSRTLEIAVPQTIGTTDELPEHQFYGVMSGKIIPFEARAHLITDLRAIKGFLDCLEDVVGKK